MGLIRIFKKARIISRISINSQINKFSLSSKNKLENDKVSLDFKEIRNEFAPWMKFGVYKNGLLSHLTNSEVIRALFVLYICSFEFFVKKSEKFLSIGLNMGFIGEKILRKTFFNQFVGGEKSEEMSLAVQKMKKRGLKLMIVPVLEEDVEDEQSASKIYDDNTNTILNIINLAANWEKKPIFQLKLSAIMPAKTMENLSKDFDSFCEIHSKLTLIESLTSSLSNPEILSNKLEMKKKDREDFLSGLKRIKKIINEAKRNNVLVLVDAEFYSCKSCISSIALALMAKHNSKSYLVGTTIQTYLKDSFLQIEEELKLANDDFKVGWFGKVVRGAYMDRERFLARKQSRESPVFNSYQETNSSYNRAISYIIENFSRRKDLKSHLVVATHNEESIRRALQKIQDVSISMDYDFLSFAQIYGMADYLSTPLVDEGFKVYKSAPYGPMSRVMPYLARRASENHSVVKGTRKERNMLQSEIKYRIFKST